MEVKRKLATIQRVNKITPIENADFIELAHVLGWQCIVAKREEVKEGDLVVYFEIDSLLPEEECFEFLRDKKFRIRTIKYRKQISQGLAVKLDALPKKWQIKNPQVGDDMTDIIGVKKYEIPVRKSYSNAERVKINPLPDYVRKTGAERIQNVNFEKMFKGKDIIVTEKLDGQSTSFAYNKELDRIVVMSHTVVVGEMDRELNVYGYPLDFVKPTFKGFRKNFYKYSWYKKHVKNYIRSKKTPVNTKFMNSSPQVKVAKKYAKDLFDGFKETPSMIIQGEVVGKEVTGAFSNYYKLDKEVEFYIFNMYDAKETKKLKWTGYIEFPGIERVPIHEVVPFGMWYSKYKNMSMLEKVEAMTNFKSDISGGVPEGIVISSGDMFVKVINNKFLLKEK